MKLSSITPNGYIAQQEILDAELEKGLNSITSTPRDALETRPAPPIADWIGSFAPPTPDQIVTTKPLVRIDNDGTQAPLEYAHSNDTFMFMSETQIHPKCAHSDDTSVSRNETQIHPEYICGDDAFMVEGESHIRFERICDDGIFMCGDETNSAEHTRGNNTRGVIHVTEDAHFPEIQNNHTMPEPPVRSETDKLIVPDADRRESAHFPKIQNYTMESEPSVRDEPGESIASDDDGVGESITLIEDGWVDRLLDSDETSVAECSPVYVVSSQYQMNASLESQSYGGDGVGDVTSIQYQEGAPPKYQSQDANGTYPETPSQDQMNALLENQSQDMGEVNSVDLEDAQVDEYSQREKEDSELMVKMRKRLTLEIKNPEFQKALFDDIKKCINDRLELLVKSVTERTISENIGMPFKRRLSHHRALVDFMGDRKKRKLTKDD